MYISLEKKSNYLFLFPDEKRRDICVHNVTGEFLSAENNILVSVFIQWRWITELLKNIPDNITLLTFRERILCSKHLTKIFLEAYIQLTRPLIFFRLFLDDYEGMRCSISDKNNKLLSPQVPLLMYSHCSQDLNLQESLSTS